MYYCIKVYLVTFSNVVFGPRNPKIQRSHRPAPSSPAVIAGAPPPTDTHEKDPNTMTATALQSTASTTTPGASRSGSSPMATASSRCNRRRTPCLGTEQHDRRKVRQMLVQEPRGHTDMYGCFITEPDDSGASFGAVFWHKDGYSTACGHGTMALGVWAVEEGIVESDPDGTTIVVIDVPSGRVAAHVESRDGSSRASPSKMSPPTSSARISKLMSTAPNTRSSWHTAGQSTHAWTLPSWAWTSPRKTTPSCAPSAERSNGLATTCPRPSMPIPGSVASTEPSFSRGMTIWPRARTRPT